MRKPIFIISILAAAFVLCAAFSYTHVGLAQSETGPFRIGERLTYNIAFDKIPNVAYAEIYVVSKGKLKGKEVVEIQSRLRTLNFVTATSFMIDTQRTVLASPTDGTTLVVKNTDNTVGIPLETLTNVSEKASGAFDISSLIYKIRNSGGAGSFTLYENEKTYNVTVSTIGTETVRSDAGEFLANVLDVKSEYLTEHGLARLRISVSSDGTNIPVRFRALTQRKNEFDALIGSIQVVAEATPSPTPSVVGSQTPRPTPQATPKAPEYVENQPLVGLPFDIGEALEYTVSTGPRQLGTIVFSVKERKLVNKADSLLLTAEVKNGTGELFRASNGFRTNVNPDTLSPYDFAAKFDGPLSSYNQTIRFDPIASKVIIGPSERIDVPIGTQNVLSLVYAMRSFNLQPSKDTANRVNDTRVAVYWQGTGQESKKAQIFTLRPSAPGTISIAGQKLPAQQISVSTGDRQLDSLQLKVWLSDDERRLPLRFSIGQYQLDLKIAAPAVEQ